MIDYISKIDALVIRAKKKAGPMGVLAFGSGMIRQILKEPGLTPEERCQHIGEISDLIYKHTLM